MITEKEKEVIEIYGKSIFDMSNEEITANDLWDSWLECLRQQAAEAE